MLDFLFGLVIGLLVGPSMFALYLYLAGVRVKHISQEDSLRGQRVDCSSGRKAEGKKPGNRTMWSTRCQEP